MADNDSRILAAIAHMPYGGLVRVTRPALPLTLEDVADYLEALRGVLEGVATRSQEERQELSALRDEVRAAGRLLARAQALAGE